MKFTKVAIFIVFLLSLCAFVLTAFLSTVRQNEREKRLALESIKVELEQKVQQMEGEKAGFQTQIADLQKQLATAQKELQEARDLTEKVRGELSGKDKELEERKKNVEDLEHAIQMSQDRNHELEESLEKLESAFQEMKKARGEIAGQASSDLSGASKPAESSGFTIQAAPSTTQTATDAKALPVTEPASKEKTETKPVAKEAETKNKMKVVSASSEAPKKETAGSQSLQAGKILLVNSKFNFVVVNMGMKQGLKIGDVFMVNSGNDKVAKVEVEKLYDDFAAAKIVEQFDKKNPLKEGNLVTRI